MIRLGAACVASLALASSILGCDLNKIAADGAAGLLIEASPKMEGYWDAHIAVQGMPAGIMQLEAMHYLSMGNEDLRVELAKAYMGYAYGKVEVDFELKEAEGDLEAADVYRARARRLYERARNLCIGAMRLRDEGIDKAIEGGEAAVAAYVRDQYDDPDDLKTLFWTAITWGAMVNMAADDPDVIADMPIAKAMAERVVELDPGYGHGAALVFLGGYECGFPEFLGGSIEKGSEIFERALEVTGRRSHPVQLQYARLCAVNSRNRKLYVELLNEIIEAPDQGSAVRLQNKIARHRAERYLGETDDLF